MATGENVGRLGPTSNLSTATVLSPGGGTARTLAEWMGDAPPVEAYGARGDGTTDDTAAILDAIARRGVVRGRAGAVYLVSDTITLGVGQGLICGGARSCYLRAAEGFAGPVVKLTSQQAILRDVDIDSATAQRWAFKGVQLYDCARANVEHVRVWYPDVGFELVGATYWNKLDVDVYRAKTIGVDLAQGGVAVPGGTTPNNNWIFFRDINGQDWPTIGDSWGIRVNGNINYFLGGEVDRFRYAVEATGGIDNRYVNFYNENTDYSIKAAAATVSYVDGHMAIQQTAIDPDAVVVSMGLDDTLMHSNLFDGQRLSAQGLAGLWWFNEGTGSAIVDRSGNGNHLAHIGGGTPTWVAGGLFGPALQFNIGSTRGVEPLAASLLDWSQPFTVAILSKYEGITGTSAALFRLANADGKYLRFDDAQATYDQIVHYNGATAPVVGLDRMRRQNGWAWHIYYVEPTTRTITMRDPVRDHVSTTLAAGFDFSAVSEVMLGREGVLKGFNGLIAFAGTWQRKLTRKEIAHLVNMRAPWAPAIVPVRAAAQADSSAADVATMKTDFNALLAKLRAAGVIAP